MITFPCVTTNEELQIVTSGKLGEAVNIIERHEVHYDIPTIMAIGAWHRERLNWCEFVIEQETGEPVRWAFQ